MTLGTDPKAVTRGGFLARVLRLITRQADTRGSGLRRLANLPALLCAVGTKGFGRRKWENAVYLA